MRTPFTVYLTLLIGAGLAVAGVVAWVWGNWPW